VSQLIKVAGWSGEPRASVVFVHGLGGHAYDTWRRSARDQSFWPLWLAEEIEGVAVYTLSYEAPASNWLGTAMPLQDRAVNVLETLLGEPALRDHPIVFIVHSLGGLIITQVLLDLQQQKGRRAEAAALLERVTQVVFIATPHTGSRKAGLLDRLWFLAWPSSVARTLVANDPSLRAINVAYRGLAEELRGKLHHRIFYETQGTQAGVIVDEASSDPGLPGDPPIPIDANHIRIAKPVDRSALLYARTRDFISGNPEPRKGGGAFIACQLPPVRREQPWNVVPKLVRVAAIVLIAIIAFKGVQALITPPPPISAGKIDDLTEGQKRLFEQNTEMIAHLQREKGIPRDALVAHLVRLGANANIKEEDIPKFLGTFATEFVDIRKRLDDLSKTSPDVASIINGARRLLEANDLDGAKSQLAKAREQIRSQRQARAREEATLLAEEGRINRLKLDYRGAAEKFAEAAALVAFDPQAAFGYISEQGNALHLQGDEFGDNPALIEAIAVWRRAAELRPRNASPDDFSAAMLSLGNALSILGERESGTARLDEAVTAYREALKERTRERVPDHWAEVQNNLGLALWRLGERESGTARLDEAVAAYREALKEWTRERVPLQWAGTQNNLGNVLATLGARESGTARLDEAVAAYREALKEWTRERVPLEWAMTQNNLGNVLAALGERESGTARLDEAVAAYREVLKEWTRERVPLQWAGTQNNLGNALLRLGERESGTARLEEAVAAYRAALTEWTRERVPLDWAMSQNNLGNALLRLGERESGTARLEEAVAAYREALKEWTRERVPLQWATNQNNLGIALSTLGEREGGTAKLEEAVTAYREALKERIRERVPLDWATSLGNEGVALARVAERRHCRDRA
jgi:tetratricopeptide (TPR) repeat protein/pimeloyl-ACP methyl ester carboxylesterase